MLVNIDIPELETAIKFYTAAFGLKLNRILDEDVAELIGASSIIYLLLHPTGSTPASTLSEARKYSRHWPPVHIDFVVNDLADAAKQIIGDGRPIFGIEYFLLITPYTE